MSNVVNAKLFFGIVLNKLQHAFPAAVFLSSDDIWPEFAKVAKGGTISVKDGKRSYRTVSLMEVSGNPELQQNYTTIMLRWMAADGFLVSDPTSSFPYDYVLSSKALAALSLSFDHDKKTVGEMLANAALRAGDAFQGELIERLVGKIFDHVQGLSA